MEEETIIEETGNTDGIDTTVTAIRKAHAVKWHVMARIEKAKVWDFGEMPADADLTVVRAAVDSRLAHCILQIRRSQGV